MVQPVLRSSRRTRRWLALGALLLLLVGLGIWRASTIRPVALKPYLSDSRPVILAHQGASAHAPSNTLEAFKLGLQQGADIIETDVHMTKDGVLVVSHDETIDRLSNGKGKIKELTLAELRQYDFGYGFTPDGGKTFPYRGKGVKIPTLEEVFQQFPGRRVNIEIKQDDPPIEEKLLALIRQYQMEEKVLICTFLKEPGIRYRQLDGGRAVQAGNMSQMITYALYWLPGLSRLYKPEVEAFQVPTSFAVGPITIRLDTKRFIDAAHHLGIKVHYWTINDEAEMRHLLEVGADGIITDAPDRAYAVMHQMGLR
jgi:glycerophosphoryl diester phosphodiesterase